MRNSLENNSNLDGWASMPVDDVFSFLKSYAFSRENLVNGTSNWSGVGNIHYGDIHATFNAPSINLKSVSVPMVKDLNFAPKNEDLLKDGDLIMADVSEDYAGIGVTVSVHGFENKRITGGLHTFVLRDVSGKTCEGFRKYIFRNPQIRNALQKIANGVAVYGISKTALSKLTLHLPSIAEQKRIVAVLETWDSAIEKLSRKIESKKVIKSRIAEELLTQKSRLSGFTNRWETVEFGEIVEYEQPTQYIVASTDYGDHKSTPVLTANKGFILGYTDEDSGIYDGRNGVIIFDDFTVDNKFVDFQFKVKSSAIKILTSKTVNINIRFVFESMQLLHFVVGQHKRHWISEYQYLTIELPTIDEQNAIVKVLSNAKLEIDLLENKLGVLNTQKQFLLSNLITGRIRTPENLKIAA